MSDELELKACPCCGGAAELMCPSGLSWWVQCSNKSCGMATKIAYSPDPVVATWNRRTEAALAKREAVAVPDGFVGISETADFEENTWTFVMLGDYRVGAGHYRITPLAASKQAAKEGKPS